MSSQRSASATISSHGNCSVFKYSHPLWVHNWNHNNTYASLSQSMAPEQSQRQSHVTGNSTPPLGMKRHAHLPPSNSPETLQFVSQVQETTAPYFPPTLLNYFHSQGHTENDSLKRQSPKTNGPDNILNTSSRQVAPSTLETWSSLSEEDPSYSKFTLGVSPSIFPSFLFPQQVINQRQSTPPPHAYRHKTNFADVRENNANVDADFIIQPRSRKLKPTPLPPPEGGQLMPPAGHRYIKKPQRNNMPQRYVKKQKPLETRVATYGRAQPESLDLSDADSTFYASPESSFSSLDIFYSPYDLPESSTNMEDGATLSDRKRCGGIKPPCFQLTTEFGEEPTSTAKARPLSNEEFDHFINETMMAAVMFYDRRTSPDILQAWDKQAKQKSVPGYQTYGSVSCDNESELCRLANIPSVPFFTMYGAGFPVFEGTHFKGW